MSNSAKELNVEESIKKAIDAVRQIFPDADVMIMTGLFDGEVSGVWFGEDEEGDTEVAEELFPGTHLIISIGDVPIPAGPGIHPGR